MKEVIVLRHGNKKGDQLSAKGIAACKSLAPKIGNFEIVVSSSRNRAIQTAKILSNKEPLIDNRASVPNFPDHVIDTLLSQQQSSTLGIIGAIWKHPTLIEAARVAGYKLLDLVQETLKSLEENQRALIISHDGTMIALEKILEKEAFETVSHTFYELEGLIVDVDLSAKVFAG